MHKLLISIENLNIIMNHILTASQIDILGSRISKIGHIESNQVQEGKLPKALIKSFYNKKDYNDLLSHIKHHEEILK